ncbi:MAG: cytidine deaminase [Clostridiales bacterium]
MDYMKLIEAANKIKNNSYSPYSNFKVGAAVRTNDGSIFLGTNIENASFGATICAERVALFSAVSSGKKDISEIAIISDKDNIIFPCGICRQVMSEFTNDKTIIICSNKKMIYEVYKLKDLLPKTFDF